MDAETERAAKRVIGAAIEVHRRLGPGYLESVYEEALAYEFELSGIGFQRQFLFALDYRGRPVGAGRLDFLVENAVVVEIKSVDALARVHAAQCLSYLRVTRFKLAILINFNVARLVDGVRRIAN